MQIKKRIIGAGRPLVCVPVVEIEENGIYKAAGQAVERGAEVLEWRIDWFAQAACQDRIEEILHKLQEICGDTILLCTFRSSLQGGEREISEEMYLGLLELIAKSGQADILDVEVSELSNPSNVIRKLHGIGQCVIGSKHYFSHTPETEQMQRDLADMQRAGADIGKLAVMPHGALDVLRLLEATARVREEYPHYPLVTMAMGGLGAISRISGEVFGSCMTFASVGKTSAPGQMPLEDVVGILNKISESMDREMVKSNIFLIGFMGTGKTTVSRSLSELLGYEEIDTDARITRRQHRSIPEIFESSGEQAFRDMETELLRELGKERHKIISCGGGMALRQENVKLMQEHGVVVLLTAEPETILARVQGSDERPILNGNMNVSYIQELMAERISNYQRAGEVVVATDLQSPQEIAEEIEKKLHSDKISFDF